MTAALTFCVPAKEVRGQDVWDIEKYPALREFAQMIAPHEPTRTVDNILKKEGQDWTGPVLNSLRRGEKFITVIAPIYTGKNIPNVYSVQIYLDGMSTRDYKIKTETFKIGQGKPAIAGCTQLMLADCP